MATAAVNLSEFDGADLPDASGMKIGLVVAEWNSEITENLARGAEETLLSLQVSKENIKRINVPGSFELVAGARMLCDRKNLDAVIAIGCVIQGETKHFDFVCQGVTYGIQELNLHQEIPVIFCVLTDNTIEQSRARSGGKHGNKGVECAVAAVKMAGVRRKIENR